MTPPLRFCFALHLHQPVGNFDSVFQQHLDDVYRPLIRALMAGEMWPVALHVSGPLLEWLDANAPDFLDEIATHAANDRLELLCGGHDEPILAVLSRQDRREQVQRHRAWIRTRLGVEPHGLWLTERVWEPTLPGDLATAGVRYVLVDDRHFRVTGFTADQLHHHFLTESGGHRLHLFPIDERLRYLVPFRPPSELADYLTQLRAAGHPIAVLGDDGEKFGGWPGTLKWLYQDGWLEDFLGTMRRLRDTGEVALTRFEHALPTTPSGGLAYLPSASYREMEGWSLPFESSRAFLRLEAEWKGPRLDGLEGGLLRGGHWRNFLVRYPESNRMHKVGMALSTLCRDAGDPIDARRAIGRAQCNDAYWHGVFGGLYLPFLRGAIWEHLALAEAILRAGEPLAIEEWDVDADGRDDVWIHSARVSMLVSTGHGGMIDLWQDLVGRQNLLNVVARHREAYHEPLYAERSEGSVAAAPIPADGGAPSIHDLETELSEIPPVDTEPRGLFVDRVVDGATTVDDFIGGTVSLIRSWADTRMQTESMVNGDRVAITMQGNGLGKALRIEGDGSAVTCDWRWNAEEFAAGSWFTSELSFSVVIDIDAPGAEVWEYPIETVAKSERGFDRTVQGTAVVLRWPIGAGRARATVTPAR